MFLPKNEQSIAQDRSAEAARREGYANIESWVIEAIPVEIRRGVTVSVQEIECGDPECAPIDVAVCILFPRCVVFVWFYCANNICLIYNKDTPSEIMLTCHVLCLCCLTSQLLIAI